MDYAKKLEEFMLEEVCPDLDLDAIGPDEELIDSGIVDSLGILLLLSFLDEEFDVDLGGQGIQPKEFSSINKIIKMIES